MQDRRKIELRPDDPEENQFIGSDEELKTEVDSFGSLIKSDRET